MIRSFLLQKTMQKQKNVIITLKMRSASALSHTKTNANTNNELITLKMPQIASLAGPMVRPMTQRTTTTTISAKTNASNTLLSICHVMCYLSWCIHQGGL